VAERAWADRAALRLLCAFDPFPSLLESYMIGRTGSTDVTILEDRFAGRKLTVQSSSQICILLF